MKIVELVSPLHPVNSLSNKAIYSHTAHLSDSLSDMGHDVHLFAAKGSVVRANLHAEVDLLSTSELAEDVKRHLVLQNISNAYSFAKKEKADLVHTHFTLLSSFFEKLVDVPTITSVHSPINDGIKKLLQGHQSRYISFSLAQRKQMPELNWYANIYHGVDTKIFAFNPEPEDYLLYLGRVTEEKGIHFAIEAAKAVGLPLKIAGASYPNEGYWHKHIEPNINGTSIQYIGEVNFLDKISLLQKAKAVLFPTMYDEVFGYVMIEAMACGTPVIGFNHGSVSEVIKDGKTGFVVNNTQEMIEALRKIDTISRKVVRKRAEDLFSLKKMISGYEHVFKRLIEEEKIKKERKS